MVFKIICDQFFYSRTYLYHLYFSREIFFSVLGLGGNPAVVGRAGELSKYVKVGNKKAKIEIELFNEERENDTIIREFDIENRSRFSLNGKAVTQEKIQKLMEKKYHIQITNLCQILPQEKLELFAKMNDHQRLENTLQTVGSVDLSKVFTELKTSKETEAMVRKKIETLKHNLNEATNKRDSMEAEAKMIKEKQFLIECLRLLKQRRAWQFYFHLKQTSNIIDGVLAEKQTVFKNMAKVLKGTEANIQASEKEVNAVKQKTKEMNNCLLEKMKTAKTKQNTINNTTEEINDLKTAFETKVAKHRSQEGDIQALKDKIRELQSNIDSFSQLGGNIDQMKQKLKEEQQKIRQIAENEEVFKYNMDQKRNQLSAINYRVNKQKDIFEIKKKVLERNYEDSVAGLNWLEQNRHLFRGEVYGPMFLYVNVNDSNNAKYLENCVSNRDLIAFICEYREDANTLLKECKEKLKLRINVVSAVQNVTQDDLRPPIPIEQLRQFGFHSFVSEFIQGPEIITNFLILNAHLHRVPVGNEHTFSFASKIPPTIQVYFTDRYRVSSSIARLTGQRIESSSELENPRFMQANVNTQDINEFLIQKEQIEAELAHMEGEYSSLRERVKVGDDRIKELNSKLKVMRDRQMSQGRTTESLKAKTRELQNAERNVVNIDVERNKCKLEVKLRIAKLCNLYLELSKLLHELFETFVEYQQCKLNERQAAKVHMRNLSIAANFVRILKQEASSLKTLEKKKKRLLHFSKRIHQWALKYTNNVDPRTPQFKKRKLFFKLNDDVVILFRLINKFQAKINCLGSSNNGLEIFLQYKKLTKEVDFLHRKIRKKEHNLNAYKENLNVKKQQWMNEVEELITRINANFQTFFMNMNCAGEIALYKGTDEDDFNGYGIHIKVKFREESDLQILNSMVQSGGERAVSVAIYLLSLQELTTVPFRCIDEINQGMDADNERRIFNLITQATEERCQTQYFLLTPKLLPKLHFTPNCKVFCPYNGVGSIPHERVSQRIERRSTQ